MVKRTGLGVVGGLVWFVVLVTGDAQRLREIDTPTAPWAWLLAVAAVSIAVVMAARSHRDVARGVCAGLLLCLALGLVEGPTASPPPGASLYAFPVLFSVGIGSVAVWVAVGAAGALAVSGRAGQRSAPARRVSAGAATR